MLIYLNLLYRRVSLFPKSFDSKFFFFSNFPDTQGARKSSFLSVSFLKMKEKGGNQTGRGGTEGAGPLAGG